MIEAIASLFSVDAFGPLLAATEGPGFLTTLLAQVWLWTKVAIGIGLVIFVHELGHFAAAKLFGVKCEKFYVGFDVPIQIGPIKLPRTLGKFRYGETEYGIGILPLGGYVKMLGQDDDPRKLEEEAKRIRVGEGEEDAEPQLDPRSYPAKPVWQRMVIISAGVVMNVITGVLFAAIAYGMGVPYTPSIVGGVTAGGPAWQAGIEPGGRVVAVGTLPEDEQLHFEEMRLAIMTEGMDAPEEPVNVSLRYGDELREYQLKTLSHPAEPDLRMIGISSPLSTKLAKNSPGMPGSAAAVVLSEADAGGRIVGFDGESIDQQAAAPASTLLDRIHSHPDQVVTLQIERADGSPHVAELPPQPAKSFGVTFAIGPVTALVTGGPAELAGVRIGDVIQAIDGDANIHAYTLPLNPITGSESVKLTLKRGDETLDVSIQPSTTLQTASPVSELGDQIGSNALGLSYRALPVVASLQATESAVEEAETGNAPEAKQVGASAMLRPGDQLQEISVRWPEGKLPEELQDVLSEEAIRSLTKGWEFGISRPLISLMDNLQVLPVGTEVRILATRPEDGRVIETTATIGLTDQFWYDRGLLLEGREMIQTAGSFTEAMALGYREGQRRLGDVFRFLGMIAQGKVKAKHVGGPVRIVAIAGSRAEQGIAKQLLFLTLLSMNLAILNFLPIPALDGGHMMFLTYELVRGKRVDEQIEMKLTLAGVLALLALMIFVFANDLLHVL